jgi:hypothetical protein
MSLVPSGSGGFSFGTGNVGAGIANIGGVVQDLFASQGDKAEAAQYRQASQDALEAAQFQQILTGVQQTQEKRALTMTIGSEQAGYATSGLAASGSALDVMRASTQQGALQQQVSAYQGAQQEYGYEEQAKSYDAMAAAADKASEGGIFGAVLQGIGAIAQLAGPIAKLLPAAAA